MKLKSFFAAIFTLMITAVFAGCSADAEPEEKHAYITVSISEESFARSVKEITPTPPERDNLSYVLKGKGPSASGFKKLGTWDTYSELESMTKIEVEPGEWQFKLEASERNNSVALTKTITKSVSYGNNLLLFELEEPKTGTGYIDVTFTFPSGIQKVKAELFNSSGKSVGTRDFYITEGSSKGTVEYKNSVEKGEYKLCFYLYPDKNDTAYLDSYTVMVKVTPGCSTTGSGELTELSEIYSINYILNGGEWNEVITIPLCYYKNSATITLPESISKNNQIFAGWYENEEFTGERITQIPSGSERNKTFYAKWGTDITCSVQELSALLSGCSNCSFTVHITDKNPLASGISPTVYETMRQFRDKNIEINLDLSACTELTMVYGFDGCTNLTGITLPKCVTSIEDNTFSSCPGLTNITIPDGITSIGKDTFEGCSGLTSITIPDSVTSIGEGALKGCSSLEEITIPFVGKSADATGDSSKFYSIFGASSSIPSSLKKVTVTGSTKIPESTFYGCSNLTDIILQDGVSTIGNSAFSGCSNLTSITIPEGVTTIEDSTFSGCSNLTSITIPDNVISIGEGAFSGCSSLEKITISEGVTSIGNSAFSDCSNLTSITIPDNVISIGEGAFSGCSSLEEITIPFVGGSKNASEADRTTLFGYIFGTSTYTGGTKTKQYYDSSDNAEYYYIPTSLRSVTVTGEKIFYGAFYNCKSIKNINITENITSIGKRAFYGCSNIKDVYYMGALEKWLNISFSNGSSNPCYSGAELYINGKKLTEVIIPDSVTSIGKYAFYGWSWLTSITIGDGVTTIGEYTFFNCKGLTSISIPNNVTSIGGYAFLSCVNLKDVYYMGTLEKWLNISFSNASSNPCCNGAELYINGEKLTEVIIPDSVTSIGEYAFYECSGLTSITIPDSVTSIGYSAFEGCSSLEEITIPFVGTSVDATGNSSKFYSIFGSSQSYIPSSLKKVTVTGGTKIPDSAFSGCSKLTSITIGDGVTSIGEYAFSNCKNLKDVYYTGTLKQWLNISFSNASSNPCCNGAELYINGEKLTEVIIPDSVTSIGDYAFRGYTSLTRITIPDSVTSIGESAFEDCSGLTSITIPNSVTSIGSYVFRGCTCLTSITIGNGVTSIGDSAFSGCTSLTSITIPNGVTSIGYSAFRGCTSLTSITVPDSVTSIDGSAFDGCSSLEEITIPFVGTSADATGDSSKFYYIFGRSQSSIPSSLKKITVTGGAKISDSAFSDCSSLTSISIPNSVTSIGYSAFYGCSGLTSLTIPDNVTNIDDSAFKDCSGLTSITIPDGITRIGYSAFYGCSGLTSLTIPDNVTNIDDFAFQYCSGLKSITIGDSVTRIGMSAFSDCSSLTSISIPNSVTSIGHSAFYGCSSLRSIVIPDSVTIIENYAFSRCTRLTNLSISGKWKGTRESDSVYISSNYLYEFTINRPSYMWTRQ